MLNQIEAGKLGIHTFTNASAYRIGEQNVWVISIEFASKEENHVQFFGQVVVDAAAVPEECTANAKGTIVVPVPGSIGDGNSSVDVSVDVDLPVKWMTDGKVCCYVTFELNEEEILLHYPVETWCSGKHVLSLYYPIERLVPNVTNTFNVYLRMENGTGGVEVGGCIASISGQAMAAAAAWDGKINIEETASGFLVGGGLKMRAFGAELKTETMELVVRGYADVVSGRTGIGAFGRPVEL